jgi:hypothetical protein
VFIKILYKSNNIYAYANNAYTPREMQHIVIMTRSQCLTIQFEMSMQGAMTLASKVGMDIFLLGSQRAGQRIYKLHNSSEYKTLNSHLCWQDVKTYIKQNLSLFYIFNNQQSSIL